MAGTQEQEGEITSINVTPLVDVCLVLVIIFMAVAPFAVQAGIKVLQSRAQAAQGKAAASENVNVRLTKDGRVTINGKTVDPLLIAPTMQTAIAASKDRMVIVTADAKNKVGQVVDLLDIAKQSGAAKIAILKDEAAHGT